MSSKSLSKSQRDLVSQFLAITGCLPDTASTVLSQQRWSLERAVDFYYSSGYASKTSKMPAVNRDSIHKLFLKYKDENNDHILAEGIIQLCEDIEVDPEDVVMLVFSWHLRAESMGEYSQTEFEGGLARLGVDSIDKLKKKLPELRAQLENPSYFKEIYNFAYLFSREKGMKCVQLDIAVAMWQLLISSRRWKLVVPWCEFLREHHKRPVSKDTWSQLLEFMNTIDDTFDNYDENGAWPYLVDEFVTWMKDKRTMAGDGTSNGV